MSLQTTTPSRDYLRLIRHLNLSYDHIDMWQLWSKTSNYFQAPVYARTPEFEHQCRYDALPSYYSLGRQKVMILAHCFHVQVYREATWALAEPILEQLQSLTIPISDVDRYLGAVGRLTRLEHVDFILDELLDYTSKSEAVRRKMSIQDRNRAIARKERLLGTVVRFVKEHTRMFPDQLVGAPKIEDGKFWPKAPQSCPDDIRTLIGMELMECLAHPLLVDVTRVKEISLQQPSDVWLREAVNASKLFQRCRSLETLKVLKLPAGCFRWAVEEKRSIENLGGSTITDGKTGDNHEASLRHSETFICAEQSLPPLTTVELRDGTPTFVDDLNDIVYAFSHTLETITVQASARTPIEEPRWMAYGGGWVDLPVLTHLSLEAGYANMVIDEALLAYCPNVVSVTIKDNVIGYLVQDLPPCLPANVALVKTLHLKGWSALRFHPATLQTTASLVDLRLTMQPVREGVYYIPPVEDLEQSFGTLGDGATSTPVPTVGRPVWSWDWYLPQLKMLDLRAEFAYRFQFKMLLGCPALQTLSLDMTSSSNQHPRHITTTELYLTGINDTSSNISSDNSSTNGQPTSTTERIVASTVRDVTMKGQWAVSDSILAEFLWGMFPQLEVLVEAGWSEYTLKGMLSMIKAHSHELKELELQAEQPLTPAEMRRLGLVYYDDELDERTCTLEVFGPTINLRNRHGLWVKYRLLKDLQAN
ncbi:hypothetical protein BGZ97_011733 [Linnemannia gamsii]|uniref:Uncharacterized protein n=1 Tax=Linnemannia gamsii TaxID=64522 RepID=A0A9P6R3D4_9FUNG|nr:hypothetical protein BGZ97_011733 [Linnemannia gamsii]